MCRLAVLLAVLTVAALTVAAQAQTETAFERGADAFREGRFEEATRLLEQAVDQTPNDAEIHYLYARVLFDERNPDRDERRAGREIDRAIELDPENVVYLVAHLEQLRGNTWNIFQELLHLRLRRDAAERVLEVDPDNAFAHEELGVQAVVEYYQYRNAIRLPGLRYRSTRIQAGRPQEERGGVEYATEEEGSYGLAPLEVTVVADPDVTPDVLDTQYGESADDRFDLEALRRQGVMVLDYAERAEAAYADAIDHLRRALESDPRRRPAYDHLVRLAVLSGRYAEVVPYLTEMYVQFPDDPEMWLYTGLVNQRLGEYEAAEVAFRQALDHMDASTREAYTDLSLILPPDEIPAYRADPETFTDRYWTSRDPRFLNTANERRSEHYARLTTAELLYRSDDLGIPGWDTERGRLFVRYGPPQTDVVIEGGFQAVLESFPDRDESFEVPEMFSEANRFNVWDYGDGVRFVFEDPGRNGQFRLYSLPADVYSLGSLTRPEAMDFELRARSEVRRQPERYTFQAPGRQVVLPYRVTAFKGEAGRTDLYVNYGIPVAESGTPSDGVQSDVDVTVQTGAFLIGPQNDLLVERRRTVYGLRGAQIVPFAETRLWTSTEPMSATPAAGYEVSLEFETASGQTSAVQRREVDVPDFSAPGLKLSDVLLAYYVEEADQPDPGRVFRDGVSVQPAPWGVFGAGDPIYLYVEAYGLGLRDGQSDYEIEANLSPKDTSRGLRRIARRLFGRGRAAVSSAFEAQGSTPDEPVYLFLDATGQPPGLYTLTVTVRDRVSGAEAEQETDLLIEASE